MTKNRIIQHLNTCLTNNAYKQALSLVLELNTALQKSVLPRIPT